jgi:hypothetical protein
VTRREVLRAGALSLFGALALPSAASARRSAKAKSVILIDLFGGPSHLDMFDPKPDAPKEIRGEFDSIATALPGVRVCEHLPRLAARLDRASLIRTLSHPYNSHNPYAVMTGFTGGNDQRDYYSRPSDWPSMGSVCHYAGLGAGGVPPYVCLPAFPGYSQGLRRCGPYGGFLGSRYNPLFSTCEPKFTRKVEEKDFYDHTLVPMGEPKLPSMQPELTLDALDRRRTLLQQLDDEAAKVDAAAPLVRQQDEAFDLLLSPRARKAFELDREGPAVRDRYGRDVFGSCMLLARRLVETGVTFVTIHTETRGNGHWDTHENNFNMLRHFLLPWLDRGLSVLLEDLEVRGLLESTLVVTMGDMGRTPRVNPKAGRDHWPQCGFCLMAGGGTKAGYVHGASDKTGAFPKDHPVSPGDICATIYELVGVDPNIMVPDPAGQPHSVVHGGSPIQAVIA